jgi:predicted O-methyltransferase YrrM
LDAKWLEPDGPADGTPESQLLTEMESLWLEAGAIWDRCEDCHEFRGFVAADYGQVFRALLSLRGKALTFLEFGSGLGVIAIMASRLGYRAYGIESESRLVGMSCELAEKYASDAQFATGNFIPQDYEWTAAHGDGDFRTVLDDLSGYDELDMELRDFDLIYAYPWPEEYPLYQDILRQCGGRNSLLLTYDVREGMLLDHCH